MTYGDPTTVEPVTVAPTAVDSTTSLVRFDVSFPTGQPPTSAADPAWDHFQRLMDGKAIFSAEERRLLPRAPVLTGLDPEVERVLVERFTRVLDAVETLAARYPQDGEVQRFFDLPPLIHDCALADTRIGRHVDHCRFDFGGDRLDDVRIFEVGGDCPVSNLHGVYNTCWRQVDAVRWFTDQYPPARCETPGWMVSELLDLARREGRDPDDIRRVAVLCGDELRSFSEIRLIEGQIRHHGRTPVHIVPSRLGGDVPPIGLLAHITRPMVAEPDRYAPLFERIASGRLLVLNGVRGRMIGGNKLVSAALSDPRFDRLFTSDQLAAIRAVVPWSRKLGDGTTAREAVDRRGDLVVKAPFDALGRSVFIGRAHDSSEWRRIVDTGMRHGWLVQEFVRSQYVPTPSGVLRRSLGAIFCGGRLVGYNGRVTPSLLDDFPAGGGVHAVFGGYGGDAPAP
ncbi:hypothetical protein B0I31_114124 [Saccharothrix carnea]|uniref:Circularly permuted ATP-grasp superfamily protein n=1 Tax=Saccharothrix carnea TaxID=1280637 RepID=A0A2P8I1F0_SACCR|nr:hypothetical protein [Saccharothrix carnea]PSL52297.1 hypothetical protein B0I31_114124 [Saccharothrix carnea]